MPIRAHDDPIEERWTLAIVSLLSGGTLDEAAEAAGVSRRTLFEWRKDPAFRAAFSREAKEVARAARAKLSGATELAVDALTMITRKWVNGRREGGIAAVEDKDGIAAAKAILAFAIGERHVVEDGANEDVRGAFDNLHDDDLRALVSDLRAKRHGAPLMIDAD